MKHPIDYSFEERNRLMWAVTVAILLLLFFKNNFYEKIHNRDSDRVCYCLVAAP